MSILSPPDDRLMAALLLRADRLDAGMLPEQHPDEETLALFAGGELNQGEHRSLVQHLSSCSDCRQAVSLVLLLQGEKVAPTRPIFPRSRKTVAYLAAAAAILLAVTAGMLMLRSGKPALGTEAELYARAESFMKSAEFDQADHVLAEAAAANIQSERLQSLQAQVLRKIPAPMALAYLGRLSDFGFAIDGAVIKDIDPLDSKDKEAKAAYDLLARAGSEDIGVLLNRGHALLTLRRPQDALREFEKAAALPSSAALAWLGKGLARFMLDDFKAAEQDFRECLRLDPSNISAKINLAVTLSEEEQWAEAIAAWDVVLGEPLDPQERKKIERVIDKLRRKPPRR